MKQAHSMTKKQKAELAAKLAWPGYARTEAEIDKLLSTLPALQADELRDLIEVARDAFEDEYERRHVELGQIGWEGWAETERLCRLINFPLGPRGET
jgi:hypothetical protein